MKRWLTIVAVVAFVTVVSAVSFRVGFRYGWQMGGMTDAAPRGVVALQLARSIDAGRTDQAKYYFESQIDAGLMYWHDVSQSQLLPFLNTLSGDDIYPGYEKYVRRLAQYRQASPSPLWDPKMTAEVGKNLAQSDPQLAKDLTDAGREAKDAMDSVVSKYAQ